METQVESERGRSWNGSGDRVMAKRRAKPYSKYLEDLIAEKSHVLSKARAFADMGLEETAQPLWATAGSYEERIAPLLDGIGRDDEAGIHRISAASCFEKSGDFSRAANLYRAALGGPLPGPARTDVERMLSACLQQLHQATVDSVA
jgi:hypothetical protein